MEIIERFATLSPCWNSNVEKADSRYTIFQTRGPLGLMLHSTGCAQPSADVFATRWNRSDNDSAMVHAFIDANDGNVRQLLRWNYRGWHCGGTGNNTHIGVEMCESSYIKYTTGAKFTILDKAKAQAHCRTAYNSAVKLFAELCKKYSLDPMTAICSHKEGGKNGIASGHVDPEHYWSGLGMSYTMDGFRADVKRAMEASEIPAPAADPVPAAPAVEALTRADVEAIINENFAGNFTGYRAELQDNDAGKWSAVQREWAIQNGYIAGVGALLDGTPNYAWGDFMTREQMVVILYKHNKQLSARLDALEARLAALEAKNGGGE